MIIYFSMYSISLHTMVISYDFLPIIYYCLLIYIETFVEAATYVAHTSVSWQLLVFLLLSYIYTKNNVSIGQNKYI